MEYRKVGRGGAGNYYSQQDIQDASHQLSEVCRFRLAVVNCRSSMSCGSSLIERSKEMSKRRSLMAPMPVSKIPPNPSTLPLDVVVLET